MKKHTHTANRQYFTTSIHARMAGVAVSGRSPLYQFTLHTHTRGTLHQYKFALEVSPLYDRTYHEYMSVDIEILYLRSS